MLVDRLSTVLPVIENWREETLLVLWISTELRTIWQNFLQYLITKTEFQSSLNKIICQKVILEQKSVHYFTENIHITVSRISQNRQKQCFTNVRAALLNIPEWIFDRIHIKSWTDVSQIPVLDYIIKIQKVSSNIFFYRSLRWSFTKCHAAFSHNSGRDFKIMLGEIGSIFWDGFS